MTFAGSELLPLDCFCAMRAPMPPADAKGRASLDPRNLDPGDWFLAPGIGGSATGGAADVLGQLLLFAAARIVAPRGFRDGLAYARIDRVGNAFEENRRIGDETPALI